MKISTLFTSGDTKTAKTFIRQANQEMAVKLSRAQKDWSFDTHNEQFVNMDEGTLVFQFDDKTVKTTMFAIGSLAYGEFLWAWDNPSLRPRDKLAADEVYAWGVKMKRSEYTARKVPADMQQSLEFTNVAAKLLNADGVYAMSFVDERTLDAEKSYLLMIFDKPQVYPHEH